MRVLGRGVDRGGGDARARAHLGVVLHVVLLSGAPTRLAVALGATAMGLSVLSRVKEGRWDGGVCGLGSKV